MPVVLLERPVDNVVFVRINRPDALNALNLEVRRMISEHFETLNADDDVRCIILTGSEKAFAAGADIKQMAEAGAVDMMLRETHKYWQAIADCPKPVIAAVSGFALGGGCELAMNADIIVAGESAQFGQPEVRLGIIPGAGGTQRLTRTVGKYQAMKLCLTAEFIKAEEALAWGLVSEIVPDDKVESRAVEMATKIARMPPLAVRQIKECVLAGLDASLATGMMLERKAFQLLFASQDQKEGMAAFIEKRKPNFTGR